MTQTEVPLYPKISPIYNKILQLAIAIVLIVLLMNFLSQFHSQQIQTIERQQDTISNDYVEQAASTLLVLLASDEKQLVKQQIEQLAKPEKVFSVVLYDETGQTIERAGEDVTVNALYGAKGLSDDRSHSLAPHFIELRSNKLYGYLQMTITKDAWQKELVESNQSSQENLRIMLLLAGIVGFLLTRGLSRFSRQGFRLKKGK